MKFNEEEFLMNPSPRIPVCLVLDTSYSMNSRGRNGKSAIEELNEGVKSFFNQIKSDEVAKASLELSVIGCGGTEGEILLDFNSIEHQSVPNLLASGLTPMGSSLEKALKILKERKNIYKEMGISYYQPWLIMMTDGEPTDDYRNVVKELKTDVQNNNLTMFSIGVGNNVNKEKLKFISPTNEIFNLKGLEFMNFFNWLSESVSRVSESTPGEAINIKEKFESWGTLS